MKRSIWLLLLCFTISSKVMFALGALPSDPCHAKPDGETTGLKNFLAFDQFDRELRAALSGQDAVALAFLVTFPLRVNDSGGTISLDDAAALKTHFQEVFTPAVRKEILSDKNQDVGCNVEGIGYARGVIWVNASERGYAIWSVNRDAVPPYPENQRNIPKINYICQTDSHRIVVDTLASGKLRYRSWNKPRTIAETPDLELANGKGTFEGTNVCAVPIYTFKNGGTVYMVEGGLGCFGDSDGPPKDATGRLQLVVPNKPPIDFWCY